MKKNFKNVLIVLLAAVCSADEDLLPIFEADKIVVTATRTESQRADIPAAMDIISKEEIATTNARTITEVLAKNSTLDVFSYTAALSSVNMRGFAPELSHIKHHILLIDGRRAGAVNLSTLLLGNVERIEVLKGPASSLYGSEAMAGVINIITRKSVETIESKIDLEGGSFGYWKSDLITGGALNEKFNFDFTFTAFGSDYYQVPKFSAGNWQWNGGDWKGNSNKNYNSSIRVGYTINENHSLNLASNLFFARDVNYFGDIYGTFGPSKEDMDRYSLDLFYQGKAGKQQFLIRGFMIKDSDIYYSNYDPMTWTEIQWYKSNVSSSNYLGLQLQNTFRVLDNNQLTFGFDYNYDNVVVKVYQPSGDRMSPYTPDNDKENYAGFVEDKISLFNNQVILTLGGRYDLYILKSLSTSYFDPTLYRVGKETLERFNPRAGLVYKVKEWGRFHSSMGTAFVVPEPLKKAGSYTSAWGYSYYGNPDLKPEKSFSYDAGCEITVSVLNLDLTYFYTDVKDKIQEKIISDTEYSYENIVKAKIRGVEQSFSFALGRLVKIDRIINLYSNITYLLKAEDITNKRDIYHVAKVKMNFGIDYQDQKLNGRLNFRYVGRMKEDNLYAIIYPGQTEVTYGDFMVTDIHIGYGITPRLMLHGKVNNLFNQAYEEKPGYPMPARNISAGISVTF
jgi:outer membrane cobalamin receptor